MEQERILNEKLKSAAESVEKGVNAYRYWKFLPNLTCFISHLRHQINKEGIVPDGNYLDDEEDEI